MSSVESPVKILLLSIFLVFLNVAIWSLGWLYVPDISGENHRMENVQAASLLLGSIIFLIVSYRASEKPSRILFISLALFYINIFLLEIDLRNVENYDTLLIGINPPGRDYWLTAAWIVVVGFFLFNARKTLSAFFSWWKTPQGLVITVAGLFYFASVPFDDNLLNLEFKTNKFLEEIMENIATTLMLLCAVLTLASKRNPHAAMHNRPDNRPGKFMSDNNIG
jgi:hypothetical protein